MQQSSFEAKKPQRTIRWAQDAAERLNGAHALDWLYRELPLSQDNSHITQMALRKLGLAYELASGAVENIPSSGPLIIICNHPYGLSDSLILLDLLLRVRPDLKLFSNTLLQRVQGLAPVVQAVHEAPSKSAQAQYMSKIRASVQHIKSGGALLLFPARRPSYPNIHEKQVCDPAWSGTAAALMRLTQANVLPLYIEGAATWPTQLAHLLNLQSVFAPRLLLNQRNQQRQLHIGSAVAAKEVIRLQPRAQTAYLRLLTDSLKRQPGDVTQQDSEVAVADTQSATDMANEIAAFPPSCCLGEQGDIAVYMAKSTRIPKILLEIGRLRELSFRQVKEGSGKALDLDRYDEHYQHLFLWHKPSQSIIGAYRIGFTEELVRQHGVSGLYAHSLFSFDEKLLNYIGPALEMGRSFVRPEWQRNFRSLRLLWSGIAAVLDRNPEIRCLFGPVSISASYSRMGRTLMQAALSTHHSDEKLQNLVRPRTPLNSTPTSKQSHQVISALSEPALLSRVIARIERGSGLPVLVRQYLDLKGRFAGFNVDALFANALDGLVFVKVEDIPPATRAKFSNLSAISKSKDQ